MAEEQVVTLGKRRRNQVSYAVDDMFDELGLPNDDDLEQHDSDEEIEEPVKKKRSKRSTKSTKSQKPFPFLSLPAELRDEIYRHCLVEPSGTVGLTSKFSRKRRIAVRCSEPSQCENPNICWQARHHNYKISGTHTLCASCQRKEVPPASLVPNILAVCKQIHAEAIDLLYGQPFAAQDTVALTTFLGHLSGPTRARLRDVTIAGWATGRSMHMGHNFAAMTLLADCTRLRRLHVNCEIRGWKGVKACADSLYRDGHVFFEAWARANGKGVKDAVVREGVLKLGDVCFERSRQNSMYWNQRRGKKDPNREEWEEEFMGELSKCLVGRKR